MKTYMYLDKDYDLPLIIAESAREMAEKRGILEQSVYQIISKAKRLGYRCRYVVVYEEEEPHDS